MSFQQTISPNDSALALIDFQSAMFEGVQSHGRKIIVDKMQVLGRPVGSCNVPTILSREV